MVSLFENIMITLRRKRFYIVCFFISQITFLFLVMVCKYSYSVGSNKELQTSFKHQFKNEFLVRNSNENRKEIKNEGSDNVSMKKNTTRAWPATTSVNAIAADTLRSVQKSIVDILTKRIYHEFLNDSPVNNLEIGETQDGSGDDKIDSQTKQNISVSLGIKEISRYKLGSFIQSSESRNILIATRGRSGSSFLGSLLSQYPGTFYSYEPLHFRMHEATPEEQVDLIKQVFRCTPSHQYIQHTTRWIALLNNNYRYRDACRSLKFLTKNSCSLPDIYSSSCSHFPIRLIKSIRFPFGKAEELLLDPDIGKTLKIIFLFRDPRGRLQSLKHKVHWCKPQNQTLDRCNVSNLCGDLKDLVAAAMNLKAKYSDRVHLVRYEDISLDPAKLSDELLKFLDLRASTYVQNYILNHTQGTNPIKRTAYSTYRNSTKEAFKWRSNILEKDVIDVQTECAEPMEILGYNPITNFSENRFNESYELLDPLLGQHL